MSARSRVCALAFAGALVMLGAQGAAHAQTQVVVPVPFLTGGIGLGEREALTQEAAQGGYNLKVVTAAAGGAYVADVSVHISDRQGTEVLQTALDGPWLFVKLPPGKYTVIASDGKQTQKRSVELSGKGMREVMFRWQRADDGKGM